MENKPAIAYEGPGARELQRRVRSRWHAHLFGQLLIAFVVFFASVAVCAAGGALLGKLIATWFPRYYPSVFPDAAARPGFDAVEVGMGTGLGQGAAVGVLVGAVIVLALAIANWRRLRPEI